MHGNGLMDVDVDCSVEEYSYEEGSDVVVLPNTEAVDATFEGLVSVTIPMDYASDAAAFARLMNAAPVDQGEVSDGTIKEKPMAIVAKHKAE